MIRIEIKGSRGSGKTRLAHFIANALRAGSHGATSVTVDGSDERERGSVTVVLDFPNPYYTGVTLGLDRDACLVRATCCTCKRWGIWFEVRLSAPGLESELIDIGPPPTCTTCAWVYAWEQTFKTIALAYLSEPFVNLISRVERVVRAGQDLDYSAKYWTDL